MHKTTVNKVICYVTKANKLLVFQPTDYSFEEVGIQVPAGTMKPGETAEQAALREVRLDLAGTEKAASLERILTKLGVL